MKSGLSLNRDNITEPHHGKTCLREFLKLACSATEASTRLEILVTETRDITLPRKRTTKVLIRLHGCAGWSVPLLFAYDIRHVFSWPGSIISVNPNGQICYIEPQPAWNNMSHKMTKTNEMTCTPSEDSGQPGHPPSLIKSIHYALNG